MDDKKSTEKQIDNDRLDAVEKASREQGVTLDNLIEFLERTNVLPKLNPATFDNWEGRLDELRREEQTKHDVNKAKNFLQSHGFLVVEDENEIDAQRLARWLDAKQNRLE